jgi:hypothetical protein
VAGKCAFVVSSLAFLSVEWELHNKLVIFTQTSPFFNFFYKMFGELTRDIVLSIDHKYITGKDVKDPGWYVHIFDDV